MTELKEKNINKYAPQERWQKAAGLVSKSYKLNIEVVNAFAEACGKKGVTQARQLTLMMKDFTQKVSEETKEETDEETNIKIKEE